LGKGEREDAKLRRLIEGRSKPPDGFLRDGPTHFFFCRPETTPCMDPAFFAAACIPHCTSAHASALPHRRFVFSARVGSCWGRTPLGLVSLLPSVLEWDIYSAEDNIITSILFRSAPFLTGCRNMADIIASQATAPSSQHAELPRTKEPLRTALSTPARSPHQRTQDHSV